MSGRGEGATRADRAAGQLWRPLVVLASELHQCEAFWRYAGEIRRSGGDESVVRKYARLYVPRSGPHGDQDVVAALLRVASDHHPERYYPWSGGKSQALRALVDLAGPVAYFADDPLEAGRLSGLREPSDPRRTGTSGRAASVGHLASLERGAELVRRRGAGLCLAYGCQTTLVERSYRTYNLDGPYGKSKRRDYCEVHDPRADYRGDLDAMRAVLIPAAYAWRASGSRISVEAPEVLPEASSPSVVTRLKADLGEASWSIWQADREHVLEHGLLAEAA